MSHDTLRLNQVALELLAGLIQHTVFHQLCSAFALPISPFKNKHIQFILISVLLLWKYGKTTATLIKERI